MPKAPQTALIAEGHFSQSWVARLPGLRKHLGPLMGLSLRNASRAAKLIKAGTPSDSYDELKKCDLILLCVPDAQLPFWLENLKTCGTNWAKSGFVLSASALDSGALHPLRELGAYTGSLSELDGLGINRFLYEGEKVVLQRLRRLIEEEGGARVFSMNERMRPVYDAGLTFAAGMTFPMIAAAVDSMRAAGLHVKVAEGAVEAAVLGALRSYLRAGKRGWSGPIAKVDRLELRKQYQALFEQDEVLAEMYLKIAVDYLVETADKPKVDREKKPATGPP